MGIFSLPAEPTRCSDLLLWFALPPWSPLRLATLFLATLVLATLVLLPQPRTTAPSTPLTPLQLGLTTLVLVLATMPGPSPAVAGPTVLSEANPLWAIPATPPSPRGRLRPSPTSATLVLATLVSATPVLATLVSDTATLVPTATASLLPASTPPTSPSLAGDSTEQTSTATF